jgi:hypothetical protein
VVGKAWRFMLRWTQQRNRDSIRWSFVTQNKWKCKSWLQKIGMVIVMMVSSVLVSAANVTIDTTDVISTIGNAAFGIHTSVYDNQMAMPIFLPG